jgi:hypothetical protein
MDGSNVVLTKKNVAARNGLCADHRSFDMLKAEHSQKTSLIPEDVEIFGEWLYAKHSIHYTGKNALTSYLQIFHVYDIKNRCFLGWDQVKDICAKMGYPTVPILAENKIYASEWEFTADLTRMAKAVIGCGHEGIVVRPAAPFHYGHFETHTGKYVRPNHVQTEEHWKDQVITKNEVEK